MAENAFTYGTMGLLNLLGKVVGCKGPKDGRKSVLAGISKLSSRNCSIISSKLHFSVGFCSCS